MRVKTAAPPQRGRDRKIRDAKKKGVTRERNFDTPMVMKSENVLLGFVSATFCFKMIPLPAAVQASTTPVSGDSSNNNPSSGRLLSSAKQKLLDLAISAFVVTLGVPSILRAQCPDDIELPTPPQDTLPIDFTPHSYESRENTSLSRLYSAPEPQN